jgi:hypothetical protein
LKQEFINYPLLTFEEGCHFSDGVVKFSLLPFVPSSGRRGINPRRIYFVEKIIRLAFKTDNT